MRQQQYYEESVPLGSRWGMLFVGEAIGGQASIRKQNTIAQPCCVHSSRVQLSPLHLFRFLPLSVRLSAAPSLPLYHAKLKL